MALAFDEARLQVADCGERAGGEGRRQRRRKDESWGWLRTKSTSAAEPAT
jgi:hypothetical protein